MDMRPFDHLVEDEAIVGEVTKALEEVCALSVFGIHCTWNAGEE